jgi:hypothetical protein
MRATVWLPGCKFFVDYFARNLMQITQTFIVRTSYQLTFRSAQIAKYSGEKRRCPCGFLRAPPFRAEQNWVVIERVSARQIVPVHSAPFPSCVARVVSGAVPSSDETQPHPSEPGAHFVLCLSSAVP